MNYYDELISRLSKDIIKHQEVIKNSKWWEFSKRNTARLNIKSFRYSIDHLMFKSMLESKKSSYGKSTIQ